MKYKAVRAFSPEAEAAAKIPQGILYLVDGDTGRRQPCFIQKWQVKHEDVATSLNLELLLVSETTDDD